MATIPASENEFPLLRLAEGAAPGTPAAGLVYVYVKSDGLLYWKDDGGTEHSIDLAAHLADASDAHDASAISVLDSGAHFTATDVEAALAELFTAIGAGGIPATIIDAAGDLIVGTAADTAGRLAIGGTNGMVLQRVSGSLAWALPAGYEFDYAQITSPVTVTATAEGSATTIVTGNAVSYDGSTVVVLECFFPYATSDATAASDNLVFCLYDGSSSIGRLGFINTVVTAAPSRHPIMLRHRFTPSNASHTYSIRCFSSANNNAAVNVGAGGSGNIMPGYIRITKA